MLHCLGRVVLVALLIECLAEGYLILFLLFAVLLTYELVHFVYALHRGCFPHLVKLCLQLVNGLDRAEHMQFFCWVGQIVWVPRVLKPLTLGLDSLADDHLLGLLFLFLE